LLAAVCFCIPSAFAQTGTVAGTVFDAQSGRPIPNAAITVNGQANDKNVTTVDGKYTLSLPPGTYKLGFTAENYAPADIADVAVRAGEVTEASIVMSNKSAVTTVDVVEKVGAVEATAEAMLAERKLSAMVSDSISRQELAGGTSSDAAGALQKVTGVSVVGEGFVFVRGLGERYSATQLNGAMIPTTEPEKRVVPLDLFPTGMIEAIRIAKTYSPDLPAEFSGGLVQMQTVEFPAKRSLSIAYKTGFNTATTFDRFLSYGGGGSGDFWGYGAGARGIPGSIPTDARLLPSKFNQQQLQAFGRSFSNNWEPSATDSARPANDWSASGGGTWGRLGLVGAYSFSNKPQLQSETVRYFKQGGTGPVVSTNYPDFREYFENARQGVVLNAGLRLTPNNILVFRNTYTHEGEKSARQFRGYEGGVGNEIFSERLRYVARTLYSSGIDGTHSVPAWHNSIFHWQFTYSGSGRDEPDLREVMRNVEPNGQLPFVGLSTSGIRFFSKLKDRIYDSQFDYSVPFYKGKVTGQFKTGMRATVRRRDFSARRFLFNLQRFTVNPLLPSNRLFASENIRPDGFQILEYTRGTDAYDASLDLYSGYGMVDLNLGPRWRLTGGVRFEDANQIVTTLDNLSLSATVRAALQNRDPIPSINLTYALSSRQNFRAAYSRTLSRPDFRELSPFDFTNTLGGFNVQGNPDLKRATIDNFDVRWEMFPGGNQLLAASFFIKTFKNPIEQIVVPSNDLRQSFSNAKGARNYGIELEFRQSLAAISQRLSDFAVSSNFTFVDSNIDLDPAAAALLTSKSRPLLGQSRYIANAILEWRRPRWRSDASFFVNHVSRRIDSVGTFRLPDIYQEGNTTLDFSYQYSFDERRKWTLRFEGENLTNNEYRWSQGDFLQRAYRMGRTFQVGMNYTIF
jgi:TonB-dependent receptor